MSNIEQLLKRQYEGTISPKEEQILNEITHRSQVLGNAERRSYIIRSRRIKLSGTICSILFIAGIIYTLQTNKTPKLSDASQIATISTNEMVVTDTCILFRQQEVDGQINLLAETNHKSTKYTHHSTTESSYSNDSDNGIVSVEACPETPTTPIREETVVACNTQCSPDSVINDIWNFLHA